MKKLFCFIFLLPILFSCGKNELSSGSYQDPFKSHLINSYSEIVVKSGIHPGSDFIYEAGWLILPADHEKLIVYDNADKMVKLLNSEGEILSTAGGEGRGPGEFGDYARLYPGLGNRFYGLDAMNHRIHQYEIIYEKIELIRTQPFEYPASYFLSSLHATEYGYFGVFSHFESYFSPDNRYMLYRLNENFEMDVKLLELPGEQRPINESQHFTMYLPNIFAERTLWDADGEWFYYLSSHNSEISRFNFISGKLEIISMVDIPDREQNNETIDFFKQQYNTIDEHVDSEQYFSILYENKSLPMFNALQVQGQTILLNTFYPAGSEGIVLLADQDTEELKLVKVPHSLVHISKRENTVYGIDLDGTGGSYEVMVLTLEKDL